VLLSGLESFQAVHPQRRISRQFDIQVTARVHSIGEWEILQTPKQIDGAFGVAIRSQPVDFVDEDGMDGKDGAHDGLHLFNRHDRLSRRDLGLVSHALQRCHAVNVVWETGGPVQWTTVGNAEKAADEAERKGDTRLSSGLRVAVDKARRFASS
jgi:hypothetical protein